MDEKQFWSLIEETREDEDTNESYLFKRLNELSENDILEFNSIFEAFMRESYNSRLWNAITRISGFVSDDMFDYFRAWLISKGEMVFSKVTEDPKCLKNYISRNEMWVNEEIMFVAYRAFKNKTGKSIYEENFQRYELNGYEWLKYKPVKQTRVVLRKKM